MLQIAIVVFREILEISLILGILTAATKEIPGRTKWILSGLTLGIAASLLLAFFTDKISESLDGMGHDWLDRSLDAKARQIYLWRIKALEQFRPRRKKTALYFTRCRLLVRAS